MSGYFTCHISFIIHMRVCVCVYAYTYINFWISPISSLCFFISSLLSFFITVSKYAIESNLYLIYNCVVSIFKFCFVLFCCVMVLLIFFTWNLTWIPTYKINKCGYELWKWNRGSSILLLSLQTWAPVLNTEVPHETQATTKKFNTPDWTQEWLPLLKNKSFLGNVILCLLQKVTTTKNP